MALIRPDHHVAWRGTEAPADPVAVIDRIRGAGTVTAAAPAGPAESIPSMSDIDKSR
jgi:hypothetical protein